MSATRVHREIVRPAEATPARTSQRSGRLRPLRAFGPWAAPPGPRGCRRPANWRRGAEREEPQPPGRAA
eukprot:10032841-Alexandrium_andersonii.AAC.1